jgi:hypothetical protein
MSKPLIALKTLVRYNTLGGKEYFAIKFMENISCYHYTLEKDGGE